MNRADILVTFTDLRSGKHFDRVVESHDGESADQLRARMRTLGFDFPFKVFAVWDDRTVQEARAEIKKDPHFWGSR